MLELLRRWVASAEARHTAALARACLLMPRKLWGDTLPLLGPSLLRAPAAVAGALKESLDSEDITPERSWVLLESLVCSDPGTAPRIEPLARILDEKATALTWDRLRAWSTHGDQRLRLSAAYTLAGWRTTQPDKAGPLLQPLTADADAQVAAAAQTAPVVPMLVITLEDLSDPSPALLPVSEEPAAPGSIDPALLDAIKIIDPEQSSEPDFEIRLLDG